MEIELGIEKLRQLGSVLMIAAHPDDENTALLAYFAKGRKLRTGYLSLTRGEGGQNLIGSEQGELMGLIRTQELLAARRIDGAEQFFSRAIDFGFSKTADETLAKWGREQVLSDVVWVIRRFQPDAIVLRFSGTPRDGHGQHQSSAILGKEAFSAAADPARFPEQLQWVKPWKTKRLFFNVFTFGRAMEQEAEKLQDKLTYDTGEFDAALGYSYGEIAGISRSQHRSQGMGAPERRGSMPNYLTLIAGEPASKDILDGVDTTWKRVPGGEAVDTALAQSLRDFSIDAPEKAVPGLLAAREKMNSLSGPWVELKRREIDELIAKAAGLWLDVSTTRPLAVPGKAFQVNVTAVNRSHVPVELSGFELSGANGDAKLGPLGYNRPASWTANLAIPAGSGFSDPYWLAQPAGETMYKVSDQQRIGWPELAPPSAKFRLKFGSQELEISRPLINRYVDNVRGELTRPAVVAPAVAVGFADRAFVFSAGSRRAVEVELRANNAAASGEVSLRAPQGWRIDPPSKHFQLADEGQVTVVAFDVTPPAGAAVGSLEAVARVGGVEIRNGMRTVDYEHIPPQTLFPEAKAKIVSTDAKVLVKKVGYVMGAGDDVPKSLRQLGLDVALLSPDDLARGDLKQFDAIVTGVRAYNTRKDLRANQQRLLDWVAQGGTMVVQYNVLEGGFMGGNPKLLEKIGPYPITVSRDRVTVEDAELKPVNADHQLLQAPNRIKPEDYEGWVQERGLYFASQWDPKYEPLWESHDPGEKPMRGGTLFARHGQGVYIFTPMAWFRQLPAGVPGAYRLFANFLSAGKVAH
ncbi:MAG: PIG-L family deacetylase [Bryobacteraceae bacterium]